MSEVTELHVRVDEQDNRVRVVVSEEIDAGNARAFEARLHEAVGNQIAVVELNLNAVTYLDSAGLRALFHLSERLQLAQIELRIVAAERTPARFAIEVAGMASICPLVD